MRHTVPICALLLICAPTTICAEESDKVLSLPSVEAWTGDFDGMIERLNIRILTVPSKTYFFLNKGEALGLAAEIGHEFEKWINKRHAKGPFDIKVVFVPTRRDHIFQELKDGKGDIAAANLTVTAARSAVIDFAKPWGSGVKEVLVTGPSAPSVASISDLGGREVMVRKSSSYYEHLIALNKRLQEDKRPAIKIVAADENLEDEDLLEMVSAGLLPWVIVNSHKAKLWARILKGLSVREDINVSDNGEIAWAVRKNSPLLQRELDEFVTTHLKFANDLASQYIYDGKIIRNSLAPD